MIKLAKYLKGRLGYIVCIVVLLFLQANCDLEMPTYTSKIINVGIQQKGIEDGVPEQMRSQTFEDLQLFMTDEQVQLLTESYSPEIQPVSTADVNSADTANTEANTANDDANATAEAATDAAADVTTAEAATDTAEVTGTLAVNPTTIFKLNNLTDDARASLADAMMNAEMAVSMFSGESEQAAAAKKMMGLDADADLLSMVRLMPEAIRKTMVLDKMEENLAKMPEMMTSQYAILFVQNEYEAMGIDLGSTQTHYLATAGLKMLGLAFVMMLCAVLATLLSARLAAGTAHDLREAVYRKVIGFHSAEFNQFSTASLITRSTNDIQQIQMFLAMGLRTVLFAPIIGIGGVLKVLNTDVSMTWILGLAVGLILVLILILFKVAMPKFTILQTLIDRLNLVSREQLTGVMVTRAFSAEEHEAERFEKANKDLTRTNLFVNRCMTFMMPIMMLIMNGVSVLIVYNGAYSVENGTMQVGDMMAFIQYAMVIIMSFLMITMMSILIPRANVAAKRINEVLTTNVEIHDPENPVTPDPAVKGTVEFDHVTFKYPDGGEAVLEDVSFKAEKGQMVAFIGSTGSGKSSLVNLIPRFFDVTSGSVKVDGVDVRDMTKEDLCSRLGYVPQKSTLFSGTIDSNIRFGKMDATEEEVRLAAQIAQAEDFIEAKDEKYNSPIAQGGTNVSGGQKQRLSIARAIAKQPEILIFDDSFSALDFKTDVALRRALKEATKDTTTLVVAQRISTILRADRIIVLDEGRVAGQGTHEELMKDCEVYRQIATSQLSEEELAR